MGFLFFKSAAERAQQDREREIRLAAAEREALARAQKAEAEADAARQRVRKQHFTLDVAERVSGMGVEGAALAIQIITGQKVPTSKMAPAQPAGTGGSSIDAEIRADYFAMLREMRNRDPMQEYERFATMDDRLRQRYGGSGGGTVVEASESDDRLVQLANTAAGVKLVEVGGPAIVGLLERLSANFAQRPAGQQPEAAITEAEPRGQPQLPASFPSAGSGQGDGLPDPREPLSTQQVIDLLERQPAPVMAQLFYERSHHDEPLRSLLQLLLETPDEQVQGAVMGWLGKNPAWTPVLRWLMGHREQTEAIVGHVKQLVYASSTPATSHQPAPAATNGHASHAAELPGF